MNIGQKHGVRRLTYTWYYPELVEANTRDKAKQLAILASSGEVTEEELNNILKVTEEKLPEPRTALEDSLLQWLKLQISDAELKGAL